MWFRRRSRKDRLVETARRLVPSRRAAVTTAKLAGGLAALTAASSGVSSLRRKNGRDGAA
jgi:hypothetical protein